jgi:hypothetical protein
MVQVHDKLASWVRWAAQQLDIELTPGEVANGVFLWEDAYGDLYDLVIDQYTADEADVLIDTLRTGDIALMTIALVKQDDDVRDTVIEKLLDRLDRRLARECREPAYYFRWYGDSPEDYRSDADTGL